MINPLTVIFQPQRIEWRQMGSRTVFETCRDGVEEQVRYTTYYNPAKRETTERRCVLRVRRPGQWAFQPVRGE